MSVSSELSREPPGPFGDVPALLTSAWSSPSSSMSRIVSTQRAILSSSERSRRMCERARLHGHSPGGGSRETVITRQPLSWKRSAVACPIPRLAPVTMIVFT
jgi:hypothetical protein